MVSLLNQIFPVRYVQPIVINVQTDDQNRERKRYTGGVVGNVTESVLLYTLSAVRCEDSGTYTCVASNGAPLTVSRSATLRVICEYIADMVLYFRYPTICIEKDTALYFRYPTICTEWQGFGLL